MNCSPLLNEALAVRTKNVQLRKEIAEIRDEIEQMEKNIDELRLKRDDLQMQCQILRSKQNDEKQRFLIEESQREFENFIRELDEMITKKTLRLPSISSPTKNQTEIVEPSIHDDFNQQFASVENWLMESAVTDVEKTPSIIDDNHAPAADDGTDDLYKDLIFPTFNEEIVSIDENHPTQHEEFLPKNNNNHSQRMDKHQRRFALMRQLAEKSNKTVTRKHL